MTSTDDFFAEHLARTPAMAILRGHGVERTVDLCRRAWDLGIALVEVPVQSAEDLEALREAVRAGRSIGRPVGAGTVISAELVAQVAEAGAAFTVAPGLDERVLAASAEAGLPHLPGVATAGEIQQALRHGAVWQKAFPASVLGPDWFSAMRGPFPHVRLVATGGVDAGNAAAFLTAGAAAVSLGSAFADADPVVVRRLAAG
jgi:2-dehydro-3-deoxyphosphogluconate aldolase / (4S)-4-hydroxy-2-oxoglutarate aldolase